MMSTTANKMELAMPASPARGVRADSRHADPGAPGAAIRWQAAFYRSYLADALQRLADDPNPDVQRIGLDLHQCLSCPSAGRCTDCPFGRGGATAFLGHR